VDEIGVALGVDTGTITESSFDRATTVAQKILGDRPTTEKLGAVEVSKVPSLLQHLKWVELSPGLWTTTKRGLKQHTEHGLTLAEAASIEGINFADHNPTTEKPGVNPHKLLKMRVDCQQAGTIRSLKSELEHLRQNIDMALKRLEANEPMDERLIANAGGLTHYIANYNFANEVLVYLNAGEK